MEKSDSLTDSELVRGATSRESRACPARQRRCNVLLPNPDSDVLLRCAHEQQLASSLWGSWLRGRVRQNSRGTWSRLSRCLQHRRRTILERYNRDRDCQGENDHERNYPGQGAVSFPLTGSTNGSGQQAPGRRSSPSMSILAMALRSRSPGCGRFGSRPVVASFRGNKQIQHPPRLVYSPPNVGLAGPDTNAAGRCKTTQFPLRGMG